MQEVLVKLIQILNAQIEIGKQIAAEYRTLSS